MKRKRTKIVIGVLLVVVGLPVTLMAAILAWGYLSDKTNASILSSGVTRREPIAPRYSRAEDSALRTRVQNDKALGAQEHQDVGDKRPP